MFKMIVLLKRKEGMTIEDFATYFQGTHVSIARNLPGLKKYLVNIVLPPPNKEPEYDGVSELWFDDRESMKKAFASAEGHRTQKDSEQFTNRMVTFFVDEREILTA